MILVLWLTSILFGSDVARLAHADYGVRESAQRRLRLWGPLALPAVLEACRSDDPEVRHRANQLAAPWLFRLADWRAAAVINDPWPVNSVRFWHDEELRHRIRRLAMANGVSAGLADQLTPSHDVCLFWWGWTLNAWAANGLYEVRDRLGVRVPWWARVLQ